MWFCKNEGKQVKYIVKLSCKTKFSVYAEVRHGVINHMIVISATGNDNGS